MIHPDSSQRPGAMAWIWHKFSYAKVICQITMQPVLCYWNNNVLFNGPILPHVDILHHQGQKVDCQFVVAAWWPYQTWYTNNLMGKVVWWLTWTLAWVLISGWESEHVDCQQAWFSVSQDSCRSDAGRTMGGHRYKVYQTSSVEWIWLMVGRATTNSSWFDPPYGRPIGTWYQNNQFAFWEHSDAAKYHY
jgi:hypothetical protein